MKKTMLVASGLLLFLVFAVLLTGAPAYAIPVVSFPQCPAVGADTSGCEFLITVTSVSGGSATAFSVAVSNPDLGPFDSSDDTLVGILNSSGSTLDSISLTGAGGLDIFGFDGDGACSGFYSPEPPASACIGGVYSTASDYTSYFPAGETASGINSAETSGTVNFTGGIANGGSNWFSLENALTTTSLLPGPGSAVPEPSSMLLLGTGLLGLIRLRARRGISAS
ncbi:MAG TPA: PEP-CTERM sorting domain-containing protein [Candidatus Acidoferrales bacterium]|nr:PEP-CTERM sorting domain-containing protein [Candidatus Acidoferrales bacterium]